MEEPDAVVSLVLYYGHWGLSGVLCGHVGPQETCFFTGSVFNFIQTWIVPVMSVDSDGLFMIFI